MQYCYFVLSSQLTLHVYRNLSLFELIVVCKFMLIKRNIHFNEPGQALAIQSNFIIPDHLDFPLNIRSQRIAISCQSNEF